MSNNDMTTIAAIPVREPVSKRKRFEVFKRDRFQCAYCGATPPGVLLECDHIMPVSAGGRSEIDNLITACQACNRGKSNVSLQDIPQGMSSRAAEVLEREAQIAGFQEIMKEKRMRLHSDAQEVLSVFCHIYAKDALPTRDFISIKNFVEKLGLDECLTSAERASAKCDYYYGGFKYFCGICWGKIKERAQS